ncbi:MAG: hypothetical protein NDP13_01050 [Crenarchaeota archaeon]|nr:hypothetical protein [Thermoproteota archaeon]MCR8454790.1 hypothetical protein [Thermoproteota archaeon]MCR8501130.1 hypothetical protein [Thermoproteota archaeon]
MSEDFDSYLLLAKNLQEINDELQYVTKLVEEAQRKLSAESLSKLRHYMAILLQKMGELYAKKSATEHRLSESKPEAIKSIDAVEEYVSRIRSYLSAISTGQLNLKVLWNTIKSNRDTIIKLSDDLRRSLETIKNLQSKYQDERSSHLQKLLVKAEKLLKVLNILSNISAVDPTIVLRFKRMIGQNVRLEPDGELALVTDLYISAEGQVFLEVASEEEIDSTVLDALYKDLGFDFMATDVSDFRAKFVRRMQARIGKQELKPSTIRHFLGVEGYLNYLSSDTLSKLQPRYKPLGYVSAENLREQRGVLLVERTLLKEPSKNFTRCPSIKMLPESVIGSLIEVGNNYLQVLTQTFLPGIGRVLICMRQDKNGEPMPDIKFVENIFLYLSRHKDLSQEERNQIAQALKIIRSGKSVEEAYWRLRIMIARSGISSEITEGSALRPSNVFLYCLQKGIPFLLSEIYAHYLCVVETDNLEVSGRNLRYKIYKEPYAFLEVFDLTKLKRSLGFECHEFLGVLVEKERLIILCAPKLERELWEKVRTEYNLPSDFVGSAAKLIKALMFIKKLKTASDYYGILDRLNVHRLVYSELAKEFDDEFIVAHAYILGLVEELIREPSGG